MRLIKFTLMTLVLGLLLILTGCDAITPADETLGEYTCEGCHSSSSMLDRVIASLDLDPPADEEHTAPG